MTDSSFSSPDSRSPRAGGRAADDVAAATERVGEDLSQLTADVTDASRRTAEHVRQEIAAAQREALQRALQLAPGIAMAGGAAVCGVLALASLHGWLQRTAEKVLPPASASFVLLTGYAGGAVGLGLAAAEWLRQAPSPVPKRSVQRAADEAKFVGEAAVESARP